MVSITRIKLLGLFLLVSPLVYGVDGVIEINQICAEQTGCFTGDTAGFPVTIVSGGSFRLTSNLVVPGLTTDGINARAINVSIDLNGFHIVSERCAQLHINCIPNDGSGHGISAFSSASNVLLPSTSVRNGGIIGMGGNGLNLGQQSNVQNVNLRWNRLHGAFVHAHSIIKDSTSFENGEWGISTIDSSIVTNNTVTKNGAGGIITNNGARVKDNTVFENSGVGISVNTGTLVSGNTVQGNSGYGGYFRGTGSNYYGNLFSGNGGGQVSKQFLNSVFNSGQNTCGTALCP